MILVTLITMNSIHKLLNLNQLEHFFYVWCSSTQLTHRSFVVILATVNSAGCEVCHHEGANRTERGAANRDISWAFIGIDWWDICRYLHIIKLGGHIIMFIIGYNLEANSWFGFGQSDDETHEQGYFMSIVWWFLWYKKRGAIENYGDW